MFSYSVSVFYLQTCLRLNKLLHTLWGAFSVAFGLSWLFVFFLFGGAKSEAMVALSYIINVMFQN